MQLDSRWVQQVPRDMELISRQLSYSSLVKHWSLIMKFFFGKKPN